MRSIRPSPGVRVLASTLVAILCAILWATPTAAVMVTKTTGDVGLWEVADNPSQPGGRCRYEGAAGSFFLRSIRGDALSVSGTENEPRSVGYRLLLQHHTANGWRTTQRGTLITAQASDSQAALLHRSRILRDPDESPNTGRYRLALKVVWFEADADVQGTVTAYVVNHRRSTDGSIGPSCRARIPTSG